MGYPKNAIRYNYMANLYMENAMESFIEAKKIFDEIKKNGENYPEYTEQSLSKKISIVIVFSAMAVESFLNDYAAATLNDDDYYNTYDSLNICNKFKLIVQFILRKEFNKKDGIYGLLSNLTKNRNKLVHNKSYECEKLVEGDYIKFLRDNLASATNAIKAVVELVNYFEENDLESSACERVFSSYTLCYFENEPEGLELKELLNLGLIFKMQPNYIVIKKEPLNPLENI